MQNMGSATVLDLVLLAFFYKCRCESHSHRDYSLLSPLLSQLFAPLKGPLIPRMAAMDTSRTRSRALSIVAALLFISSLILHLLHFFSVGSSVPIDGPEDAGYKQRYSVLGSRPPRCIKKCNACKPCLPALVPQRQHRVKKTLSSRDDDDDDGYYLLAWKCRCGNKFFLP